MAVYQNFRAGNLKQGQPLGLTETSVNLNTDNTSGAPYYYDPKFSMAGLLNLYSTGTNANVAADRNITLTAINEVGFELYIVFNSSVPQENPPVAGTATATVRFTSYGAEQSWVPTHKGDYMILMSNGTDWTLINNVEGGAAIGGSLSYQGTWDASSNTPTLSDPPLPATQGFYYLVSVAGTQFSLTFAPGDWIVSSGSAWQKVDNSENDMVLGSAQVYVGSASNVATGRALTGDIAITNTGVTSIAAGVIVDADVNGSAAIALSKLATVGGNRAVVSDAAGVMTNSPTTDTEIGYVSGVTSAIQAQIDSKLTRALTDTNIFVGNGLNVATAVAMSADATLANTGALTIANGVVTLAKLSSNVMVEVSGTLSQAQILNLNATPVTLISAPPAGQYIVIDEMEVLHTYSTAVYINGGILQVEYSGGTDILSLPVTLVTDASSATYLSTAGSYAAAQSAGTGSLNITTGIGQAVQITNLVAAFLNGDVANILKYRIRYHLVTALT